MFVQSYNPTLETAMFVQSLSPEVIGDPMSSDQVMNQRAVVAYLQIDRPLDHSARFRPTSSDLEQVILLCVVVLWTT